MILLDTHALIWWATGSANLSTGARRAIDDASRVGVSAISAWEVAMLVAHRRLALDRDTLTWLKQALALPRVELLPLSPEVAVKSVQLELQGDPADRILAATAMVESAALVTRDEKLRRVPGLTTVW